MTVKFTSSSTFEVNLRKRQYFLQPFDNEKQVRQWIAAHELRCMHCTFLHIDVRLWCFVSICVSEQIIAQYLVAEY